VEESVLARRLTPRSGINLEQLAERLRKLGELDDLPPRARRRLNEILRDVQTLEETQPSGPRRPEITPDVKRVVLKPSDLSNPVSTITSRPDLPAVDTLDFVTTTVMERIRDRLPEALPLRPVPTGSKGADLPITSTALSRLLQLAAVARSEGQDSVIWDDGVNQLIVHASRIKAVVTDGQVRIDIPVAADGLKTTMRVPFAVGSEDRLAGLVAATVSRPAGNAVVARVWGDALVALAYGALMDAVESMAGASGRDVKNDRLLPRALVARQGQLTIESQARFRFKGQTR
jgi:hypothetical protein